MSSDHFDSAPLVAVRKGTFQHGTSIVESAFCGKTRTTKKPTLTDINITVPKGVIYCLMGASGCGKSTLLSCIVGLRKLTSGYIAVLGADPAQRHALGRSIAYMPQEIALYPEFDISETLDYFGRLCGALSYDSKSNRDDVDSSRRKFKDRVAEILELLELPPKGKLVKKLSGGQQRRVSLAACLVFNPRLFVLDEPTAGLDARIRTRIWHHFESLVASGEVSVLVTTHLEEEAKKAHVFAIMQSGRVLAEDSPSNMVSTFGMDTLSHVIYHVLCSEEEKSGENLEAVAEEAGIAAALKSMLSSCLHLARRFRMSMNTAGSQHYDVKDMEREMVAQSNRHSQAASEPRLLEYRKDDASPALPSLSQAGRCPRPDSLFSSRRARSLLYKNFITLKRKTSLLAFSFLMPALIVISFCSALGKNPHGLRLVVDNRETSDCSKEAAPSINCDEPHGLACRFVEELFRSDTFFRAEVVVDADSARAGVANGDTWGVIEVGKNFSKALSKRINDGAFSSKDIIDESTTWVRVDSSSTEVLRSMQVGVAQAYQSFLEGVMKKCVGIEDSAAPFVRFVDLHDDAQLDDLEQRPRLMEFMAPGVVTLIVFFLPMAATSVTFLLERANGLLNRSLVAGVRPAEIVVSHVVSQMMVLVAQVTTALVVMLAVYKVPCAGPIGWLVALAMAHGATGMCYGILLSTLCSDIVTSIYVALGSFLPMILLGGVVASLESMSPGLKLFSQLLPCTLPCQAMRDIMSRGWSVHAPSVQAGFVSSFVWGIVFVGIACIAIKMRTK